jgi:single-stranded-DNA-specific exonuclease
MVRWQLNSSGGGVEPVSQRRWRINNPDITVTKRLTHETKISPLVAMLLVNRGLSEPSAAARFLSSTLAELHDPYLLLDMDRAVERLAVAIARRERVCVYGDYDVDGISAVALLISFFRTIGLDCFYHIPKRLGPATGFPAKGWKT